MTNKSRVQVLSAPLLETSNVAGKSIPKYLKWLAWGGLLLLALVVRLYHLTEPSLWQDEIWSVYVAQLSPGDMLNVIRTQDLHPPLYYFLLGLVTPFGADNNLTLRGLSTLFDLLAFWPLYLFARRMAGERAAWITLLLFSLSSLHLIFSQTVRMYTLLALLALLSYYFFWRIMAEVKASKILLAAYIAATTAMLYTQNLAPFHLIPQGLAVLLLFRRKPLIIRAGLLWIISLLLWSPCIVIYLQQLGSDTFYGTPDILLLVSGFVSFGAVDTAHNGQPFALLSLQQPYFLLGLGLLAWLGFRNLRERKAERTYLLLIWLVPLSLDWVVGQFKSVYADRAFLVSSFAFLILLGASFNRFDPAKKRVFQSFWGPLLGGVLTVTLSVVSIFLLANGSFARDDLRGLGQDATRQLAGSEQQRFLLQFNGNNPIIFEHYNSPQTPRNIATFDNEVEERLNAGPGRVCAITAYSTEQLSFAREAHDKFSNWLAARSFKAAYFKQNYPDDSLKLECWNYRP